MRRLHIYIRLRRAYRKYGVLPYSRRKTWDDAGFVVRIERLP